MWSRALLLMLSALALAGAGAWWDQWRGVAVALALLLVAAFAFDTWHARRLLAWLRRPEQAEPPALAGPWREAGIRMNRLIKTSDLAVADAQQRLSDFLAAIQASPNGVVLLDERGRIEWCNLTAAQHFGIEPDRDALQAIGNLVRDPVFAAYWARVGARRAPSEGEVTLDGREHSPSNPQRLSLQVHPYAEGRYLLLSRDVTALERAEAMRRDFVANVSHEIRTPLTVLSGFIETLQNLPLGEGERRSYLGLMNQQAQRLNSLVGDLLTLSRLEGSPAPGVKEWIPIRDLIAQCESEGMALTRIAGGPTIELRLGTGASDEVAGAHQELLSAMSNLVSNAIRYTPPQDGQVRISWNRRPDGSGEFSVEDNGPGIEPEHLPRLTERFYRVDRSRSRDTGGTGLGLAIVKHVVQRHGGSLAISSQPGLGSRFAISFPPLRVRRGPATVAPVDAQLAAADTPEPG